MGTNAFEAMMEETGFWYTKAGEAENVRKLVTTFSKDLKMVE